MIISASHASNTTTTIILGTLFQLQTHQCLLRPLSFEALILHLTDGKGRRVDTLYKKSLSSAKGSVGLLSWLLAFRAFAYLRQLIILSHRKASWKSLNSCDGKLTEPLRGRETNIGNQARKAWFYTDYSTCNLTCNLHIIVPTCYQTDRQDLSCQKQALPWMMHSWSVQCKSEFPVPCTTTDREDMALFSSQTGFDFAQVHSWSCPR